MDAKDKSILDGVPVQEEGFPLRKPPLRALEVVTSCSFCGAPIYGHKRIFNDEDPEIKRSCVCLGLQQRSLTDSMKTK